MRIFINPASCHPFHGNSVDLGEVEMAVQQLARALHELGAEVYVATLFPNPPKTQPMYIHPMQAFLLGAFDLVIGVRHWQSLWPPFKGRIKLYWVLEGSDSIHNVGLGDPRVNHLFHHLVCVSEWQRESLCQSSGYPKELALLLPFGVDLSQFRPEEKERKRIVYSGGLAEPILQEIRKKHPDVTWQQNGKLANAAIFLYLSNTPEPRCKTILEAEAAGCCVVATDIGAVSESVGEAAILIPPDSSKQCVEALDRLLSEDAYFHALSQKALEQSKKTDWKVRAAEFIGKIK